MIDLSLSIHDNPPSLQKKRRTFDSPWKDVLEVFFKDFLTFCFSPMANEIDWHKDPIFLDKE